MHWLDAYTETEEPAPVPNNPENNIPTPYFKKKTTFKLVAFPERVTKEIKRKKIHRLVTCQPTPRLRTEGGTGVALAYLATAMKAPVDC